MCCPDAQSMDISEICQRIIASPLETDWIGPQEITKFLHEMVSFYSARPNIVRFEGKTVFIDTLSFEKHEEGKPWVAYRQFCQHFLAPLALMSYTDVRLNQLFRTYIDGVPLDLASTLLPFGTRFRFSLLIHIHLHARSQKRYAGKAVKTDNRKLSPLAMHGLVDGLETAVRKLKWQAHGTEWVDYYQDTNYSPAASEDKKNVVAEFLEELESGDVWDLGANVGVFSRIASRKGIPTISFDIDPASVERNYLRCSENGDTGMLPLLVDLTNPSPPIGWKNEERMSLLQRGPTDTVLALALIHHLAISNNLPLNMIATFFHQICNSLIIEFVPKEDSQVRRLLETREDIFPDYTQQAFESEFRKYFIIKKSKKIEDSARTLYIMTRR